MKELIRARMVKSIALLESEITNIPIISGLEPFLRDYDTLQICYSCRLYMHSLIAVSEVYINQNNEPEQIRIYEAKVLEILKNNASPELVFSKRTALGNSEFYDITSPNIGFEHMANAIRIISLLSRQPELKEIVHKYSDKFFEYQHRILRHLIRNQIIHYRILEEIVESATIYPTRKYG